MIVVLEGNEELEDNTFAGDPIYRHQHHSQNVEDTNNDNRTNQQQNIVDIEASSASDSEGSDFGGATKEGTADADNEVESTSWFRKTFPLLLLFRKASLLFIVVFITDLTGSSPRFHLQTHSLVCIKNDSFVVGIGPIINKEFKFIYRSDRFERTCVKNVTQSVRLLVYKP